MHLVQDNWRRERKDSGPLHTEAQQEEQKKRPVNQTAVRVSSKKGYSSSVSSKASHTASPLKISTATFYSNVQSKREHKGVTFYMFNVLRIFMFGEYFYMYQSTCNFNLSWPYFFN